MQTKLEKEGGKLTVAVSGRVDTTTSPELEKTIFENIDGITALVLDLKEMAYISSAGLRVLLKVTKAMKTQGEMTLIHVNSDVMEVFDMTGFSDILNIK